MFWSKKEAVVSVQAEFNRLRLEQYDILMEKLKQYDWFEFGSGGGITAHKNNEPEGAMYGTCFTVPYEMIKFVEE